MRAYYLVYSTEKEIEGPSPIPEDIYNFVVNETDLGLDFSVQLKNIHGYVFGVYDAVNKKLHSFKKLPTTATLGQIQKVVIDIYNGVYENYQINDDNESGTDGDPSSTSVIPLDIGDGTNGGILPFNILPEWLRNLLNGIFGNSLNIPWWVYAAIGAYSGTKVFQRDSNKILWGGVGAFTLYIALKAYKKSKNG
jgi:hypothetical protein